MSGEEWTRRYDDTGRPFDVKLRLVDGRPQVVGIRWDDGEKVTASQLRVRLTEIEEAFGAAEDLGPLDDVRCQGRGKAPPTDEQLEALTRVLANERLRGERGSVARTARAMGMHRATVYRWLRSARERDL